MVANSNHGQDAPAAAGRQWYLNSNHGQDAHATFSSFWVVSFRAYHLADLSEISNSRPICFKVNPRWRSSRETANVSVTFTRPDYAALRKESPTDRGMLQFVVDKSELLNMEGPRFTKISGGTRFRPLLGTEVAWFDQTWEERGNTAEPDAVLVLHNVGLVCVHPRDASRGIFLLASHRIKRGEAAQLDAAALAEEAARGLTISTPRN